MDDVRSLDTLLHIGDDIDREILREEFLECVFLYLSLYLHAALVGFSVGILDCLLCHLELLLHLSHTLLVFEAHLVSLELGTLFGLLF